jgi:hypothetical protein
MVRVSTAPSNLVAEIERTVRSRTFGQVHDLRIELAEQSVVLRGRVDSYYLKQLAQHAALDALSGHDLVNEIVVKSVPALSASVSRP